MVTPFDDSGAVDHQKARDLARYLVDQGSDRLWQNKPVSSALYSPQAGGAYILPSTHLFGRTATITLKVTPDVAMPYSSKVQGIFLGYKIVQGPVYQP